MTDKCISSERIYDGRVINVRRDRVLLPSGSESVREVVEHRPAVVIIAENDAGELILISQFRYPVGAEILELPAGIVEPGENREEAASRELQEETGQRPGRLEHVAALWSSPGFTDELFELFYATELTAHSLPQDDDEFITARAYGRAEVERMVADGAICDCKTLMGVLWWLRRTDGR